MATRRDVLHTISAAALGVTAGTTVAGALVKADTGQSPPAISVQAFHDALVPLEPFAEGETARNNLFSAWEVIAPTKFDEYVFVTWCGTRPSYPVNEFAEEFARRRRGERSLLPDHPVFDMMYGNWRIPVYREQWGRAMTALTGLRSSECKELNMRIYRKNVTLDIFSAMVRANPFLPDSVQDDHIPLIWDLKDTTFRMSVPLANLAMLTGRTLDLAGES